jgi:hypothetical protein
MGKIEKFPILQITGFLFKQNKLTEANMQIADLVIQALGVLFLPCLWWMLNRFEKSLEDVRKDINKDFAILLSQHSLNLEAQIYAQNNSLRALKDEMRYFSEMSEVKRETLIARLEKIEATLEKNPQDRGFKINAERSHSD